MASPAAARALLRDLALRPRLLAARSQAAHFTPRRWLNLQEYQSKKLMADNGVKVQRFFVVDTANEALEAAKKLSKLTLPVECVAPISEPLPFSTGSAFPPVTLLCCGLYSVTDPVGTVNCKDAKEIVLKAQILAGGRGKGVFSSGLKGGVHLTKDPKVVGQLAKQMIGYNLTTKQTPKEGVKVNKAADEIKKLYHLFLKIDATQVEVNPFGETPEGQVVCFDAKINFDDNAEFRQKDIFAMDDGSENEPIENEAAKYDLKYIGLDGNIACFVNGAGLAMATCDIIFLNGGKPANFLDLGGGVQEAQVYQAFKLLTADPKVEAILVNIFGGIVNCAIIANGITKACRELELKVPLVVRLEGTNVHEAQRILGSSGLPITSAVDLEDAAKKAVASVAKK
uniref:Succinate-CoA ligase GDP-forming subunit beta n=1 Tax=Myotis myotis TaxID=51298 RepID=A0A7J7UEG9_MYOMY|nr:succinate-CoA ligase GDP-forming subunit beta [Myotis myotis]